MDFPGTSGSGEAGTPQCRLLLDEANLKRGGAACDPIPRFKAPVCQAHDKKYNLRQAEIPIHQVIFDELGFLFLVFFVPIVWYKIFVNRPPIFANIFSERSVVEVSVIDDNNL